MLSHANRAMLRPLARRRIVATKTTTKSVYHLQSPQQRVNLLVRWSTTQAAKTTPVVPQAASPWSSRFRRLAKVVKYVRIPFLMVSVYALGRQQGIIECSR